MCFCSKKYIWDSNHENVTEINESLEICNHCKSQYEYCLNYNSEKKSFWTDMMEKKLKWNKRQNFDDENDETISNIKF